jgi:hypothetical protein
MDKEEVLSFVRGMEKETQLKTLCMRLMGTPEYQLC